ncbi:MAG: DUF58 domain-containing protein [Synergistaceae bacterium]|jgi:uncharacterized protein (DUF58 family)|nr:DUF58 domain-containing protein [Synergistaceae bacterium]
MVYIVISILLGVVAINSANNLLYLVTAVLLGYMLASGLAGRGNIRNAQVSVFFPDEIYAQVPCAAVVQVTNKSRFVPLFLIEVALEKRGGRVFFPVIQPGKSERLAFFTTFPSRGRHRVEDIELSSVYPFNFFVRYWPVDFETSATVFPCPLRCDLTLVFVPRDPKNHQGEDAASEEETDIVGVRPYVEGDPMKRIHWKSSARTGKLQTRLYDGTSGQRGRVIDLDRLVEGDLERGLSMAAYAVVESMKSRLPVGLRSRGKIIPPAANFAHNKDLMTRLALYE